jgi:hypothetical protein
MSEYLNSNNTSRQRHPQHHPYQPPPPLQQPLPHGQQQQLPNLQVQVPSSSSAMRNGPNHNNMNHNHNHSNTVALVGGGGIIQVSDDSMNSTTAGTTSTTTSETWIQVPRDPDVLCGRGGAALRHPGNQTYRRLVNLNKGLYITCLKTEKLKISRSIVAAIREQNGRFIEKNTTNDMWYDIGDKKAVEKTSQALREGQPKLRQRIVELGEAGSNTEAGADGNANEAILFTHLTTPQYGANNEILIHGIDHSIPRGNRQSQSESDGTAPSISVSHNNNNEDVPSSSSILQLLGNNMSSTSMTSHGNSTMNHLMMNSSSTSNNNHINTSQPEMNAEYLLHRLSIQDLNQSGNITSLNCSMTSNSNTNNNNNNINLSNTSLFQQQQILQQQQQLLIQQQQQILFNQQQQQQQQNPSATARAVVARELGISESQLSIMSDFSFYNGGSGAVGAGTSTNNSSMNGSLYSMLNGSAMNTNNNSAMNMFHPNANSSTTSNKNMLVNASGLQLQQDLMNFESFRNNHSLMGLPIGSGFHMNSTSNNATSTDQSQQQQLQPLPVESQPNPMGVPYPNTMNSQNPNYNATNLMQQQQQQIIQQQQLLQLQQNQKYIQDQQQQQQLSGVAATTGQTAPTQQQQPQQHYPSHATSTAVGPGSRDRQNFDRRRVFAKMKYVREPSAQLDPSVSTANIPSSVQGGGGGNNTNNDTDRHNRPMTSEQQQQQQPTTPNSVHSINTIGTMASNTDLPGFHVVESNTNNGIESSAMSFFSTLSNVMPSNRNYDNTSHQQQQQYSNNVSGMQSHIPTTFRRDNGDIEISNYQDPNAPLPYEQQMELLQKEHQHLLNASNNLTYNNHNNNRTTTLDTGYSKVVVESAKVIDHSAARSSNSNPTIFGSNYDAMSVGSKMSMMSGLSRISDGNENDSIFSDLSKKIGNVSTRSMAMSEMSALEIQELNDEDDHDDEEQQQQQNEEETHHDSSMINIDTSSSHPLHDHFDGH